MRRRRHPRTGSIRATCVRSLRLLWVCPRPCRCACGLTHSCPPGACSGRGSLVRIGGLGGLRLGAGEVGAQSAEAGRLGGDDPFRPAPAKPERPPDMGKATLTMLAPSTTISCAAMMSSARPWRCCRPPAVPGVARRSPAGDRLRLRHERLLLNSWPCSRPVRRCQRGGRPGIGQLDESRRRAASHPARRSRRPATIASRCGGSLPGRHICGGGDGRSLNWGGSGMTGGCRAPAERPVRRPRRCAQAA